jgi:spore maturation protein CgeB
MLDKARFYLAHDEARQQIAAAGRARCERSGYSSVELLRNIVESL